MGKLKVLLYSILNRPASNYEQYLMGGMIEDGLYTKPENVKAHSIGKNLIKRLQEIKT